MQDLSIFNESFLIIGGPNTNKSEVSRLLSKILNYKLINLDREKHHFFDDFTDYDFNTYQKLKDNNEIKALNYIHKYEMKHLEYIIDNIETNVIIDFGNTYTLIDDIKILNKIKLFKNIILLENEDNLNKDNSLKNKLYRNKVNYCLATIKINIKNKDANMIVKDILNKKEFKDVL